MDEEKLTGSLESIGIDSIGIKHWLSIIRNGDDIVSYFDKRQFFADPIEWYNPKIINILRLHLDQDLYLNYLRLMVVEKLLPHPNDITNWADMRSNLRSIALHSGFISDRDRNIDSDSTFANRVLSAGYASTSDWIEQYLMGHFWGILIAAVRRLKHSGPPLSDASASYLDMLARLVEPSPSIPPRDVDTSGLLILSAHSRFNYELTKQTKIQHRERSFIVTGQLTKNTVSIQALPMLMIKTLKAGKVAYIAVDGGRGSLSHQEKVFGVNVHFPGSFGWASWKTGCACVWEFLAANEKAAGTHLISQKIDVPHIPDFDLYIETFLKDVVQKIEHSMLYHPFSFGSYQDTLNKIQNNRYDD